MLGAGAIALTDRLTLLYSHRYLHEAAAAEAERAALQDRAFAVVLVHADEVEHVNERRRLRRRRRAPAHRARGRSRGSACGWGATACREGGLTLALLVPPERARGARRARGRDARGAARLRRRSGSSVETWRPGDTGDAVIARARASLDAAGEPSL